MSLNPVYDGHDTVLVGPVTEPEGDRVGTFEYSPRRGRLCWSPAVSAMYGYAHEPVEPSLDLLVQHAHVDDRARVAEFLQRVVEGKSVSSRHRIVDRAGKQRWIAMVGNPTSDSARGGSRARGLVVDVTDVVQSGVAEAVAEVVNSRLGIEQAKGVLRAAYGISADEAFGMLVRRSQTTNTKLRDVAGRLLDAVSGGVATGLRLQVDTVLKSVSAAS